MNKHPGLMAEIRKSGQSWQYYYEKWTLNGENDPMFKPYTHKESNKSTNDSQSKILGQLMKLTQNLDINKVQKQVQQLDQTIHTIQGMLNQYLENQNKNKQNASNEFNWFRD